MEESNIFFNIEQIGESEYTVSIVQRAAINVQHEEIIIALAPKTYKTKTEAEEWIQSFSNAIYSIYKEWEYKYNIK